MHSVRKILFILTVVASIAFSVFCGSDPAGVTTPISISSPDGGSVWEHYQSGYEIAWTGGSTDNVSIKLFQGNEEVTTVSSAAPNSGNYQLQGIVSPDWGTGSNFSIKIEDGMGVSAFSPEFRVEPANGEEIISVTEPDANTQWSFYEENVSVSWRYPESGKRDGDVSHSSASTIGLPRSLSGDTVSIGLYNGEVLVATLGSGIQASAGSFTYSGYVDPSWGVGNSFRIKVMDNLENYGFSSEFTISDPTGEIIIITEPESSTEWFHYQTGMDVQWYYDDKSGGESLAHIATGMAPVLPAVSGDSLSIDLYDGSTWVATLASGVPASQGSYQISVQVDPSWGIGSNYSVKLVDNQSNYGFSSKFSISEPTGQEMITVIQPDSDTEWQFQQSSTTVVWDYPAPAKTTRFLTGILPGCRVEGNDSETVRIEVWKDSQKLGDYSGWVPNTGTYTRTDPLPSSWGTGLNYQVKVIDENDNYGFSEMFLISGTIDVTKPTSSTIWNVGQQNTQVEWDGGAAQVKLELWDSGAYVDDYSGWIDNNGTYTREAPIPSSWSIGEHFRIRVVEPGSTPNEGYSSEFQIYEEVVVTEPSESTQWAWGEEGVLIEWDEDYSETVKISLYKNDTYLGDVSGWIPNTGSYTRAEPLPCSWGTGDTYTVLVEGDLGSSGVSSEFEMWAIDIAEPSSSTVWYWNQANTQVNWVPGAGNLVRMEVWEDGNKVDDYCGWTDNDGSYTRSDAVPESWGSGTKYRVRLISEYGDEAYSEEFRIKNIPYAGLVGYWKLDGDSNDYSGNGHHGEPASGVSYNANDRYGNPNSALNVSSSSGYIGIPNHEQLEVQSHTISAWVKHVPDGNGGGVFNNGGTGTVDHYALRGSSVWVSHIIEYDQSGYDHKYDTAILNDGAWHHIVVTYDTEYSVIWIDGVQKSEYNRNTDINYNTHHDCYIGMNFPGGHDWFEGAIDDVRLYNRVLTANEIQLLFNE